MTANSTGFMNSGSVDYHIDSTVHVHVHAQALGRQLAIWLDNLLLL